MRQKVAFDQCARTNCWGAVGGRRLRQAERGADYSATLGSVSRRYLHMSSFDYQRNRLSTTESRATPMSIRGWSYLDAAIAKVTIHQAGGFDIAVVKWPCRGQEGRHYGCGMLKTE